MSEKQSSGKIRWVFVLLICAAAAVRLVAVFTYPLWIDEALTLTRARHDLGWLLKIHFPLSYIIFHFSGLALGVSTLSIRLTAMLFDLLGLAGIYLLGRKMFDSRVGLAAMAVAVFSPQNIRMAHFARYPALMFLFALLSTYFFWEYFEKKRVRDLALHLMFFLMAFFTHPYGFLFYPIFFVWIIIFHWKDKVLRNRWIAAQAVMAAPIPILIWKLDLLAGKGASSQVDFGFIPLIQVWTHLKTLPFGAFPKIYGELLIGIHCSSGRGIILLAAGALLAAIGIAAAFIWGRKHPGVRFCLLAVILTPVLAYICMLFWGLWFRSQYLGFCAIYLYLLMGWCVVNSARRLKYLLGSVLVLLLGVVTALYIVHPFRTLSSDGVARIVESQWRQGDAIALFPAIEEPLFQELLPGHEFHLTTQIPGGVQAGSAENQADKSEQGVQNQMLFRQGFESDLIKSPEQAELFWKNLVRNQRLWIIFARGRIHRDDKNGYLFDSLERNFKVLNHWRYEPVWNSGPTADMFLVEPASEKENSGVGNP